MLRLRMAMAMAVVFVSSIAGAANITWIGANADWFDGVGNANWNPGDEPDSDDTAIFNTNNTVNLGSNNAILALTMSGGIDLFTSGFDLDVNGAVQLVDSSTTLIVGGANSLLTADAMTINNGADVELSGGAIEINEESGNGLLAINPGGVLVGHGTLTMTDAVAAGTVLIRNDGVITARRDPLVLFGVPPVGTLSINATDLDARIDLDGAGESGDVNVTRNQTLDVNIPLSDSFNGTITLAHNATLDMSSAWTLGAGTINADNGFVNGVFPNPDIPAATSFIAGAALTQSGGTINVVDADGALQFDAAFTMTGGAFINNGHTIFNANATINPAATFTMGANGSDLTVGPNADVLIDQASFNLDGTAAGTVITVNQGGVLTLDLGDYDNDAAPNAFDGVFTVNSGTVILNVSDAEFVMDGTLNVNNTTGLAVQWIGDRIAIGNDTSALDADLNVGGAGNTVFHAAVDFNSDADVEIAANGDLILLDTANFDTVNGANNAEFTGAGRLRFNGIANFNEAVTFNMTGGLVDFDGLDTATGDVITINAPVTVNAATVESFGKVNTVGANTLHINNFGGTAVLTVNLDDPNAEWTLNTDGFMNLVNDNNAATLLAGSDVNLNGTVNVTGDVRIDARVDIAGTVNINTAGQPLRLSGGDASSNVNTINGATILGDGQLGADTGTALHGFGPINTDIVFEGTANLRASGGTLTITGDIIDVNNLGTADDTGTLNVVNPWNSGAASSVNLMGGELKGGAITVENTGGITGNGLVSARVINNTRLRATQGGTLVFQTAANDNDWDGSGAGELSASVGSTLELRDVDAAFDFGGAVGASGGGRVFANGFALNFNPGSTIELNAATYESTSSTDIGGTVTVIPGPPSTIKVAENSFLTFQSGSSSTLDGNLLLQNNNINIEAGATFSGAGALVIPDGSHLVVDDGGFVNVLLVNEGTFNPGGISTVGVVIVKDYSQSSAGDLIIDLDGALPNQFDRLQATGTTQIDGTLFVDLDPGFNPALGATFDVVSTAFGLSGEFDLVDYDGLPADKTFHVDYLANAVRLTVVSKPLFSADFDNDGDVDASDLVVWDGAFDLNQLGDADGDNDSDGNDFLLWQQQVGSAPAVTAATALPEPATLTLVLLASLFRLGAPPRGPYRP